jgi:flagellar biosynthesis protein FlhF
MNASIHIRSFRANSLHEALRRVRLELGPDAIILETKHSSRYRFSWARHRVEVIASCGQPSEPIAPNPCSDPHGNSDPQGASESNAVLPAAATSAPSTDDPTPVAPSEAIHRGGETRYPDRYIEIASQLLRRDLPTDRVEAWIQRALQDLGPEIQDGWMLRSYLSRALRDEIEIDRPTQQWHSNPSPIAVIGPPGHGKSTVVAKLASLACIHHGLNPCVIACLNPSATIHPRLSQYCDLMDWSFEQVDAPKLPTAVAAALDRGQWVILDVPSISLGEFETLQRWRSILRSDLHVSQIHFVISATTGVPHARRLLDWYLGLSPTHLLPTRLDEAQGLGGLYPFLGSSRLPLGFAGCGPKIPEDLFECDPARLACWVLGTEFSPNTELLPITERNAAP